MQIHVVADATDRSGGYVVERLLQHGGELTWLDRDALDVGWGAFGVDLLLILGSSRSAHDARWSLQVAAEEAIIRTSLSAGVPVMGICYGAQVIARALGGTSYRGDGAEAGWRRVDTIDDVLCPEGPWAMMHRDVFSPPRTARVLGTTWFGPQCFVDESLGGRALAWQFHPEVTPETFERWVDEDADVVRASGDDPAELKRQARRHAASSRNAAHALADAALLHLGVVAGS